jgi:ribosomal-protein-alanine N-acetyltransferase
LTYLIRPMERSDLPQVNEIDREAFPSQWPPPNYRQELQNRVAHYIVVCDDTRELPATEATRRQSWLDRLLRRKRTPGDGSGPTPQYIAGFCGIWMMAGEAHVTNIAVRHDYRGRGLGELLLIAIIDLASRLEATFLTLEVRVSNMVARRLYEKYGFVQTGLRRSYYLDNHEDAVIMSTESIASPAFQERLHKLREELKKKLG